MMHYSAGVFNGGVVTGACSETVAATAVLEQQPSSNDEFVAGLSLAHKHHGAARALHANFAVTLGKL